MLERTDPATTSTGVMAIIVRNPSDSTGTEDLRETLIAVPDSL